MSHDLSRRGSEHSFCVASLVRRPPPPPQLLTRGPLAKLALYDPEGLALAEQALDDFFPALEYVASHSTGSRIRNKYGPKYFVNKYELSMAFLAAENFEVCALSAQAANTRAR